MTSTAIQRPNVAPVSEVVPKEFLGNGYEPEYKPLPYLQVLNHADADRCGFFLPVEHAAAVNFNPNGEWQTYEAYFQTGGAVSGFRCLTARFLILRRSPLAMYSRADRRYLGPYDRDQYNRDSMVLKTRHLIYLISKDKKLLHDIPLQFTAKGSFCGSFGENYQAFREEFEKAIGKKRGDKFFALTIFAVKIKPELKGKAPKQSWVSSVSQHGVPTAENARCYFVGDDAGLKAKLLADFDAHKDFGKQVNDVSSGNGDGGFDEASEAGF